MADPDYSDYEFEWEPKGIRIHWTLRGKHEGMIPVAKGKSFALATARRKAFAAMEANEADGWMPRIETGEELKQKVMAQDLADRH